MLQSIRYDQGETLIEYTNRVEELVSKLECAEHVVSKVENKKVLLRGFLGEFDVTAKTVLD